MGRPRGIEEASKKVGRKGHFWLAIGPRRPATLGPPNLLFTCNLFGTCEQSGRPHGPVTPTHVHHRHPQHHAQHGQHIRIHSSHCPHPAVTAVSQHAATPMPVPQRRPDSQPQAVAWPRPQRPRPTHTHTPAGRPATGRAAQSQHPQQPTHPQPRCHSHGQPQLRHAVALCH